MHPAYASHGIDLAVNIFVTDFAELFTFEILADADKMFMGIFPVPHGRFSKWLQEAMENL
jgi:hypothetical protein